jgi:hypothetical protein
MSQPTTVKTDESVKMCDNFLVPMLEWLSEWSCMKNILQILMVSLKMKRVCGMVV